MTGQQIDRDRLRELAENATPGPWEASNTTVAAITGPGGCGGCSGLLSPAHEPSCYWSEIAGACEADAEFIAASRQAVPALLDMLDQAEAERDQAQAALDRVRELHQPCNHDAPCRGDCSECGQHMPCDTIRALDGEQ